ncbi:MAG: DUF3955 domain-containing protein [Ignavibacteriales bacterium]
MYFLTNNIFSFQLHVILGGEQDMDPMDRRKQLIAGAIIFFAVLAAVICFYFIIFKANKIPSKGIYVESFKTIAISEFR